VVLPDDRLPPHEGDAVDQAGNDTSGSGVDSSMPGNRSDCASNFTIGGSGTLLALSTGSPGMGGRFQNGTPLLRTLHIAVALRHPFRWSSTRPSWLTCDSAGPAQARPDSIALAEKRGLRGGKSVRVASVSEPPSASNITP